MFVVGHTIILMAIFPVNVLSSSEGHNFGEFYLAGLSITMLLCSPRTQYHSQQTVFYLEEWGRFQKFVFRMCVSNAGYDAMVTTASSGKPVHFTFRALHTKQRCDYFLTTLL